MSNLHQHLENLRAAEREAAMLAAEHESAAAQGLDYAEYLKCMEYEHGLDNTSWDTMWA